MRPPSLEEISKGTRDFYTPASRKPGASLGTTEYWLLLDLSQQSYRYGWRFDARYFFERTATVEGQMQHVYLKTGNDADPRVVKAGACRVCKA